jgi:hypothetical protein
MCFPRCTTTQLLPLLLAVALSPIAKADSIIRIEKADKTLATDVRVESATVVRKTDHGPRTITVPYDEWTCDAGICTSAVLDPSVVEVELHVYSQSLGPAQFTICYSQLASTEHPIVRFPSQGSQTVASRQTCCYTPTSCGCSSGGCSSGGCSSGGCSSTACCPAPCAPQPCSGCQSCGVCSRPSDEVLAVSPKCWQNRTGQISSAIRPIVAAPSIPAAAPMFSMRQTHRPILIIGGDVVADGATRS